MISSIGSMTTNQVSGQRPPGPPPPPPDSEEGFSSLDADESSSLNLEELQTVADHLSEITGVTMSAEDLMEKLDIDGSGTVEMKEMPAPKQDSFRGPPPFMAEDGSVTDSPQGLGNFNPLDSLLSYLSAGDEEESSAYSLSLEA